jgi:uncharacterized protein
MGASEVGGAPALEPVVFACEGEQLVGCLHPAARATPGGDGRTGVVIIVGGPQYRAGSHRQYIHLARALSQAGYPTLRFDVRGMGDSTGEARNLMHITPDIGAAVDELQRRAPGVTRVVLWGLCGGASAALLYLHDRQDRRIAGLCLVNPWVRTEQTEARTQLKHYYTARLRQREFWLKLLRGGVALRAARELAGAVSKARRPERAPVEAGFLDRMRAAWLAFDGPVLVALSGRDFTAKEFLDLTVADRRWQPALTARSTSRLDVAQADHTFSDQADMHQLHHDIVCWLTAALPRPLSHAEPAKPGSDGPPRAAPAPAPDRPSGLGIACALAVAVVTALSPGAAQAQVSSAMCGPVWGTDHFGPMDYRTQRSWATRMVEPVHFTPKVENLIAGESGTLGADINYTLRAFPNHHRALISATRLAERGKNDQPPGMLWPVECYFERAIRFAPDDVVVRSLYAQWLGKRGRRPEAESQLETALKTAQDSPISNYSIGLVYFELGDFDKALAQAHRARELGWPRQELAQQLKSAGKWREPAESAAPAATAASEPATAPSAPR